MPGFNLPVDPDKGNKGAIVDVGAAQNNVERSFDFSGNPGAQIDILQSQDNFVTDEVYVGTLNAPDGSTVAKGAQKIIKTIARYYRTVNRELGEGSATPECWMGDMVPSGASAPGATVRGTLTTDGLGGIVVDPGAAGIAGVAFVNTGGLNQVRVTFAAPFADANYVVEASWFSTTVAPSIFRGIAFDTPGPTADGRTDADVTFATYFGNAPTDPTTTAMKIMLTCQ